MQSDEKLNLAWLVAGPEGGGIRTAICSLASACRELGHATHMLALSDGPMLEAGERAGMNVIRLGLPTPKNFSGGLINKALRVARALRYARTHAPAIAGALRSVHADSLDVLSPSLLRLTSIAARQAGAVPVWEMPNTIGDSLPFDLNRKLYQRVLRRYGVLTLANSAHTAASLGAEIALDANADDASRPIVFYAATDSGRFDPDRVVPTDRSSLGIGADAVVAAIIARVVPDKGQAVAIEALGSMKDAGHVHLLIVGGADDPAFVEGLHARVAGLGLANRVHFIAETREPERYLAMADLTLGVRGSIEPFGLSSVESLLMRKPALVRAVGGPAEIVRDGKTGWHILDATPDAVVAGLRRALNDRAKWPAMGNVGRADALTRFAAPVLATRYVELIRQRRSRNRGGR